MAKTLYTVKEVGEILCVSDTAVFRLIKDGLLEAICIKNKYYIFIKSFNSWFYGERSS